jgi:hypothetical protein
MFHSLNSYISADFADPLPKAQAIGCDLTQERRTRGAFGGVNIMRGLIPPCRAERHPCHPESTALLRHD